MIILIILIIVLLLSFTYIKNIFENETTILDDVKLKGEEPNNNGFAVMIEQDDGTYKESESNLWPTDMVFNSELSGCIDVNGNKIDNALSFNTSTNAVMVSTNKTAYCYLYFDKDKEAPIVRVTINNNNTKNVILTISSNEDGEYCVNSSSVITDMNNCVFNGNINKNESVTTGAFTTSGDYYVHVKDKANNIGISEKQSISIPIPISDYLIENVSSNVLWNSTLEGDGYRYVGTNPNNYICFGTSDKNSCVNDTDKYMYRIIGIFEDSTGNKHIKLIKKEALNTTYAWNSNYSTDVDWNKSNLYNGLNGSYFLTNASYPYMQDSSWTNKISNWNYTMTNTLTYSSAYGTSYFYSPAKVVYLHELNRSSKTNQTCYYSTSTSGSGYCSKGTWKNVNTKISIMYASDYQLSLGNTALNYTSSSNASTLKTGWIHLSHNDTSAPNDYEWTMSLYGGNAYSHSGAWNIYTSGEIQRHYVENTVSVRPVFYLESNVAFAGDFGDGSLTNPYLIY